MLVRSSSGEQRPAGAPMGRRGVRSIKQEDWHTVIPDAHPGYISWQQYQDNLQHCDPAQAHGHSDATARRAKDQPCCKIG